MVHVTDRAKDALLQKKLEANIHDPEIGLRLAAHPSGTLGLVVDRAKAGDQVVRHRNSTVLLVDPQISDLVVASRMVDCRETDGGRGAELVLTRRGPSTRPDVPRP